MGSIFFIWYSVEGVKVAGREINLTGEAGLCITVFVTVGTAVNICCEEGGGNTVRRLVIDLVLLKLLISDLTGTASYTV
jgi:hypothetical protein